MELAIAPLPTLGIHASPTCHENVDRRTGRNDRFARLTIPYIVAAREPKPRDGCIADKECQAEWTGRATSCWLSKGLTLAPRFWAPFFWAIRNHSHRSALARDSRRAPRALCVQNPNSR